jgi:UDP-N-acetylglucosamine:LPS N-acetylglucosamine transferase
MQSNKITIQEIIDRSVPHGYKKDGRRSTIETEKFILSIVGGSQGLYGDFKDTFEVAVIDKKNGDFVTKLFEPEAIDDVMGYVPADKVVEIANYFVEKNVSKLD